MGIYGNYSNPWDSYGIEDYEGEIEGGSDTVESQPNLPEYREDPSWRLKCHGFLLECGSLHAIISRAPSIYRVQPSIYSIEIDPAELVRAAKEESQIDLQNAAQIETNAVNREPSELFNPPPVIADNFKAPSSSSNWLENLLSFFYSILYPRRFRI